MQTLPVWATGKIAQIVLTLAILGAIGWAVGTALDWRKAAKANAATVQTQTGKIEATTGITTDAATADTQRASTDTAVSSARDTYHADIKEARRNEPATAARADRAIPNSVRNAARKRRLARERLDGAESQRP